MDIGHYRNKRTVEKMSSDLSRLLQGQNFESEEQVRNCILAVYLLGFHVITSYGAKSFKMLAPNPGGAANLDAQANKERLM